jgi:predicted DCC family thiol-disulfide oxidoreductase YuxK
MANNKGNNMNEEPIILYDGNCNLCTWSIQIINDQDSDGIFTFVDLQSTSGQGPITTKWTNTDLLESVILIEGHRYLTKSDAILRVFSQLPGRWKYLSFLSYIPKPVRDVVYDLIAKYRYKLFGQRTASPLPVQDGKGSSLD